MKFFCTLRNNLGWYPAKMAKALGISQGHYELLERKYRSCRSDLIIRAFEISGLSVEEFWKLLVDTHKK